MAYAGFVRSCNAPQVACTIYKDALLWRSLPGKPRRYHNISIFPIMTGAGIMPMLVLVKQSWDSGWVSHTESGAS